MTQALDTATQTLLEPTGLGLRDLERVLDRLMSSRLDAADVYCENTRLESWVLEDGIIREGSFSIEQGAGLRAMAGEKTGFAFTDELQLPALLEAGDAARAIAQAGESRHVSLRRGNGARALYPALNPLTSLDEAAKVELLRRVDAEARAQDPRVTQVIVNLVAAYDVMLVAGSDGTLGSDVRPLVRMNCSVIVEANGRREQGSAGGGARGPLGFLIEEDRALGFAREAVRQALVNLEAVDAPAGTMTVVLGPGWPGILLHEAIGHGLEGDFNRKRTSAFTDRIGTKVASELCTVVDDGTLPGRRGSLNVDDEGTPTGRTVLIERGVLRGYLQDRQNAALMGMPLTGNGRRESFAHAPMPRMTNTFMLAGEDAPEDIIRSVDRGLYAVSFGGGQVDITSGKFVFSASEAYLIEGGVVGRPVRDATLIGNGPDVLTRISRIGGDLALDEGLGTCGKDGQSVPVGVGLPTIRIDGLTVGGTGA